MPIMNGLQAIKTLKEMASKKEINSLIIIVCTAMTTKEDYNRSMEAGAHAFLKKPI